VLKDFPNLTLRAFGRGKFVTATPPEKEDVRLAEEALRLAREVVENGKFDIVILDEINVALKLKLISLEEVLKVVKSKPKSVELVLTGRDAPEEIVQAADLVTEMREVKHPFHKGLQARKGIEF
jgi:cob(I)alamin adenosyltransferase